MCSLLIRWGLSSVLVASLILALGCGSSKEEAKTDGDSDSAELESDTPAELETYAYDSPVQATSPWPQFRRTMGNTGRSPLVPRKAGLPLWSFAAAKGIFHAPVIDGEGTIYIGTADTTFYALKRDGSEKWRFKTGEIIDSSALLGADGTIYVPSGDGHIYALDQTGKEKWRLASPGQTGYITWWEGHITMGANGTLYAGNDDYHLYAISQAGSILWSFATKDQVWSCPGISPDGSLFVGSNDVFLHQISTKPKQLHSWITLGPVTSSPAIAQNGKLVVFGSFDGYVYGVDPSTGTVPKWSFPARDHIYGSAAIAQDGTIYIGSADGSLYALNPDGTKKWAFDTLDPIRSSPAIDGEGTIYFGGGDGRLYAINPDGTRKWSYDTSDSDRNDLNGSPAIHQDGIVIGGEAGKIFLIPYDYCETHATDTKCSVNPEEDLPKDGAFLYAYTPGGTSLATLTEPLVPTNLLTFRLVVRKDGDTVGARIDPKSVKVTPTGFTISSTEVTANGYFLNILPTLAAGKSYTVAIEGDYLTGGDRQGNKFSGGDVTGHFSKTISFSTQTNTTLTWPLAITDTQSSVVRLKRLAVPQPPLMTTFNQIGFDSYNYLLGLIRQSTSSGKFVILAAEGTPGLEPVINQTTKSIFVLNGERADRFFNLESQGFKLDVTGVSIALDRFLISGKMEDGPKAAPLDIFASVTCGNIENFGSSLDMLGLCAPDTGIMTLNGTALFEKHTGTEGTRPAGLSVAQVTWTKSGGTHNQGAIEATFSANTYKAAEHLPALIVIDTASERAVELSYGENLERIQDANGLLAGVRLNLPEGNTLGTLTSPKVIVAFDLYPLYEGELKAR